MNYSYTDFGTNPRMMQPYRGKKRAGFEISDMENTYITLDKALEFVGDNSTFQKRIGYLFCVQWGFFTFLIMGMPFLFQAPVFMCKATPDATEETVCDEYVACQLGAFNISTEKSHQSLALRFELYCGRNYLIGICGSVFLLGCSIGGFLFPLLSDSRGRKFSLLVTIILAGVSTIIAGLVTNFGLFMLFIMIAGIGFSGFETLTLVYVAEISAVRFRSYSTVALTAVGGFAQVVLSGVLLISNNWRVITILFIGIPFLITSYFSWLYLCETPRYLVSRKRYADAKFILNWIAVTNRRPQFKYRLDGEKEDVSYNASQDYLQNNVSHQSSEHTYISLFRFQSLRKILLFTLYMWFFRYFAYYGLNFSLASFGANIYANFTISAFVETFACLLSAPIKTRMNRIESMMLSAIIVSLGCLLIVFFPIPNDCYNNNESCYQKTMSVICAVVVKFGVSIFVNILITYTSEIYPTVVRTLGFGLCMTFGRASSIAMPIIVQEMQDYEINPVFSFGFLGFVAIVLLIFMPESKDNMTEVIEEEEQANENPDAPLLQVDKKDSDNKHH